MSRFLTLICLMLALAYAGYWVIGRTTTEDGARDLLAGLEDRGWSVSYDHLATRGFPSRFDTTVTELALTTPSGQTGLALPVLQAFALSYAPTQIIAVFPPEAELTIAGRSRLLQAEDLRARLDMSATPALPLETLTLEGTNLRLRLAPGLSMTVPRLLAAARPAPGENAYQLYLEAPGAQVTGMDPADLQLDAVLTLSAPLSRQSLGAPPDIRSLTVTNADLALGSTALSLDGTLTWGASGLPGGTLTGTARNASLLPGLLPRLADGPVSLTITDGAVTAVTSAP